MQLIRSQAVDDLSAEIKKRFAEFNRARPKAKGRRYPADLRKLVRQAALEGVKPSTLRRLTGLSPHGLKRWLDASQPEIRRLEIVPAAEKMPPQVNKGGPAIIPAAQATRPLAASIRLPSGAMIEFHEKDALTPDVVRALMGAEVSFYAASR